MRRGFILVIMVAAVLLSTWHGKEPTMSVNPAVGVSLGYTPETWAALTPEQRAAAKARASGLSTGNVASQINPSALSGLPQMDAAPTTSMYDSGPSSGEYTISAAPAAPVLAQSPEWLAYLNALNLEEQQYRADTDKTRALYQSDAERQKQDLAPVYGQSRRNLAGSLESRGMARSGEYLRRVAENRAQEGRQRAGIDSTLAGQNFGLESQLAQKLMSLGTQRADREMQMRSQGYV